MSRALSPSVSAGDNALKTAWWSPQTLFAFSGLDIAGQALPYPDSSGGRESTNRAAELWYRVIDNVDPEVNRAKCCRIDVVDSDGIGSAETRAALSDGRFYHHDMHGTELRVDVGDQFLKGFPHTAPPPLTELPLRWRLGGVATPKPADRTTGLCSRSSDERRPRR